MTALTVPYAFFCAGLYQMAFWLPFDINGFSYLSLSDIIMSFIQPFLYSSFATIMLYIFNYYILSSVRPYGGGNTEPPSTAKKRLRIVFESLYITLILTAVTFAETRLKSELLPFILLPGIYFTLSEFLLKNGLMKHEKVRFIVLYILVTLPVISFYTGTKNAYQIYDNKDYQYSTLIIPNDTLKYLSKASDFYIFVSLDNKDKYFFSTDEIKGLKLNGHKSNYTLIE